MNNNSASENSNQNDLKKSCNFSKNESITESCDKLRSDKSSTELVLRSKQPKRGRKKKEETIMVSESTEDQKIRLSCNTGGLFPKLLNSELDDSTVVKETEYQSQVKQKRKVSPDKEKSSDSQESISEKRPNRRGYKGKRNEDERKNDSPIIEIKTKRPRRGLRKNKEVIIQSNSDEPINNNSELDDSTVVKETESQSQLNQSRKVNPDEEKSSDSQESSSEKRPNRRGYKGKRNEDKKRKNVLPMMEIKAKRPRRGLRKNKEEVIIQPVTDESTNYNLELDNSTVVKETDYQRQVNQKCKVSPDKDKNSLSQESSFEKLLDRRGYKSKRNKDEKRKNVLPVVEIKAKQPRRGLRKNKEEINIQPVSDEPINYTSELDNYILVKDTEYQSQENQKRRVSPDEDKSSASQEISSEKRPNKRGCKGGSEEETIPAPVRRESTFVLPDKGITEEETVPGPVRRESTFVLPDKGVSEEETIPAPVRRESTFVLPDKGDSEEENVPVPVRSDFTFIFSDKGSKKSPYGSMKRPATSSINGSVSKKPPYGSLKRPTTSSINGSGSVVKKRSAVKMPNFKKIHEKLFNRMESLTDHKKRQLERAGNLIQSPKVPRCALLSPKPLSSRNSVVLSNVAVKVRQLRTSLNPSPLATKLKSPVPSIKSCGAPPSVNRFGFRKIVKKDEAVKIIGEKLPSLNLVEKKNNGRELLQGVRKNKRFLLQMQMRQKTEN